MRRRPARAAPEAASPRHAAPPKPSAAKPSAAKPSAAKPIAAKASATGDAGKKSGKKPEAPIFEPLSKNRRALSHVGGKVTLSGSDPELQKKLAHALDVEPDDRATRAHIHGFHSYPARLHPVTASRLIEALSEPNQTVLDPFCGSGTVLVEARIAGRRALGSDLNPLAVELSSFKATLGGNGPRPWLPEARRVAEYAEGRRYSKAGPSRRYDRFELELFDIHVLLELDSLVSSIAETRARGTRRALLLTLSAILTKVSRRAGDSAGYRGQKRIAGGYATRLFEEKVVELLARADQYTRLLGERPPSAKVFESDARKLDEIHADSIHAIISSPPYPGTFDYLEHHADRIRWLRMSDRRLAQGEIGSRRHLHPLGPVEAVKRWRSELHATLKELASKLVPGGRLALVLADSVVADRPLYADDLMPVVIRDLPLALEGTASQRRPHVHRPTAQAFRDRARMEHVFVLRRTK